MGCSVKELKKAFELVEDEEHWKNPIDKQVSSDVDINAISDAITFFTGTFAVITKNQNGYRVQALGYWGGDCG